MRVRILIPRPGKGINGRRSTRLAAVVMMIAAGGTLYALLGEGGLMAVWRMRARATQLRYEIYETQHTNRALLDEIRALRNDPQAIEKLAREELHMARPDETIYLLPPELPPSPQTSPGKLDETGPRSPAPSLPSRR